MDLCSSSSYYGLLGVRMDSSADEIRRAYHKLAMQWHPDRWAQNPNFLGEAKRKFQQIQEAYSVLSDHRKRTMYDAGLYDPQEEDEDEGFCDFVQEMMSLMAQTRKEEKEYSMEELQEMLKEMAQGFNSDPLYQFGGCGSSVLDNNNSQQKTKGFDLNQLPETSSYLYHSYCN